MSEEPKSLREELAALEAVDSGLLRPEQAPASDEPATSIDDAMAMYRSGMPAMAFTTLAQHVRSLQRRVLELERQVLLAHGHLKDLDGLIDLTDAQWVEMQKIFPPQGGPV